MKYVAVAVLALTVSCAAWAEAPAPPQGSLFSFGSASDQPMDIKSNKFQARIIPGGREGVFTGAVKVTQGDLTLHAEKLVVVYDGEKAQSVSEATDKRLPKDLQGAKNIRSIVAEGNVKIAQNDRMVMAWRAEYDNAKRTITLTGGPPQFWQGEDHGSAQTIIIFLDEQRIEMRDGTWRLNPNTRRLLNVDPLGPGRKSPM